MINIPFRVQDVFSRDRIIPYVPHRVFFCDWKYKDIIQDVYTFFFFFFKDLMINISAICLKSLWFEINNLMICLKCSSLATLMAEIPLFSDRWYGLSRRNRLDDVSVGGMMSVSS